MAEVSSKKSKIVEEDPFVEEEEDEEDRESSDQQDCGDEEMEDDDYEPSQKNAAKKKAPPPPPPKRAGRKPTAAARGRGGSTRTGRRAPASKFVAAKNISGPVKKTISNAVAGNNLKDDGEPQKQLYISYEKFPKEGRSEIHLTGENGRMSVFGSRQIPNVVTRLMRFSLWADIKSEMYDQLIDELIQLKEDHFNRQSNKNYFN